jgi:hypothetical protein
MRQQTNQLSSDLNRSLNDANSYEEYEEHLTPTVDLQPHSDTAVNTITTAASHTNESPAWTTLLPRPREWRGTGLAGAQAVERELMGEAEEASTTSVAGIVHALSLPTCASTVQEPKCEAPGLSLLAIVPHTPGSEVCESVARMDSIIPTSEAKPAVRAPATKTGSLGAPIGGNRPWTRHGPCPECGMVSLVQPSRYVLIQGRHNWLFPMAGDRTRWGGGRMPQMQSAIGKVDDRRAVGC